MMNFGFVTTVDLISVKRSQKRRKQKPNPKFVFLSKTCKKKYKKMSKRKKLLINTLRFRTQKKKYRKITKKKRIEK